MATNRAQLTGMLLLGVVFDVAGIIFLIAGHTAIGCAMLGVGLGFFVGLAVRKSSRGGSLATQPPPTGSSTGG